MTAKKTSLNPWPKDSKEPLVRLHLISVPLTQSNIDLLQAQVDDLGGTILEEVTTDKNAEKIATIIFDENLDN